MITTTVFANEASDKCDQRKDNWEWNGHINRWQCIGGDEIIVLAPISTEVNATELNVTIEANATEAAGEGFTAKKALVYAALSVVVAGAIVTAIVLTPVWIIKSIFK